MERVGGWVWREGRGVGVERVGVGVWREGRGRGRGVGVERG